MKPSRLTSLCAWLLSAALLLNTLLPSAFAAPVETENAILSGQLEDRTTELFACFNGLMPEEEYLVLVSRSSSDPLAPENLLYLTQAVSSEFGTLEVPFRAAEKEAAFVVACRQGVTELVSHNITVEGGTASLEAAAPGATVFITADDPPESKAFSGWTVTSGGVVLADPAASSTTFVMGNEDVVLTAEFKSVETPAPSEPETPATPKPSSDGTTALLVLGAGAIAAVTAGVVLLAPVEVSGRLEMPDHQPIPNAIIALSQNGVLYAQTTTNAQGEFGFKVRRGDYDLELLILSESGEPIRQNYSIHAPLRGLNLYASPSN